MFMYQYIKSVKSASNKKWEATEKLTRLGIDPDTDQFLLLLQSRQQMVSLSE